MLLYTYIFVILFNFGTSSPIPNITPYCNGGACVQSNCPPNYYLQNGMCYLGLNIAHPVQSTLSAISSASVVTQPCVNAPCQTAVSQASVLAQSCTNAPCQTAVSQASVVTQPCTLGTTVTQPCTLPTSPNICPTLPCPTGYCPPCPTQCCPSGPTPCCPPCPTPCCPPCPTSSYLPCKNVTCPVCPDCPANSSTTEAPPRTTTPTSKPINCPVGTILINNYCHLIYCGRGIYRNGKCIEIECLEGTIWTGSRCEIPTPQNHTTLYISNVVNTTVNQIGVNHAINYTNNMFIHITESPNTIISPSPPSKPTKCCNVITPVVCRWQMKRYICRSKRYRRCGLSYSSPNIYLRPPVTVTLPPPLPAPTMTQCFENDCNYNIPEPFYPDCSSCDYSFDEYCTTYCQRSVCQTTEQCQSVDLRGYCDSYPGSIGCRRVDGCTQDWCG